MLTKEKRDTSKDVASILSESMFRHLFPSKLELVPQINEMYELELAYYESRLLSDEEIIRNGAYFARVSDTFTRHFLMCSGEPVRLPQHSSSRLRSFFQSKQFKTGYGTHGLFPYRGKFHPQMIKGLINIMGLKPGDKVLDPMMGSGTVLIEAKLMGIKSVGIDASPFCRFMVQSKLDGLSIPLTPVKAALYDSRDAFEYFKKKAGEPARASKMRTREYSQDLFSNINTLVSDSVSGNGKGNLPKGCEEEHVYNFILLAYLDSVGYSERSDRKSPYEQFRAILERYLFVAEKIQKVLEGAEKDLADAKPMVGDARKLPLANSSMDGVLFSPPYSFAIDYLENDSFHLKYFGVDIEELRKGMVGLRGEDLLEKYNGYKTDMEKVLAECSRVLRPRKICTIVVGTNNNQLSKALEVPLEQVQGIDELMIELGARHGLRLIKKLERQITGMANTMRSEYIVMLEKA